MSYQYDCLCGTGERAEPHDPLCYQYNHRKEEEMQNVDYLALACFPEQSAAQEASNFVWRALQYVKERKPYEYMTIAILTEKCYDIMDAYLGPEKAKGIN